MTRAALCVRALAGSVLVASTAAQSLVNGGSVHGSLAAPGERDTYTFSAGAGDRVELRLVDLDAGLLEPRLEVFDPGGVRVATAVGPDVAEVDSLTVANRAAGTYTTVVSDGSSTQSATGAYELHLARVPGANEGGELADGQGAFDRIERGDLDSYTLRLNPGGTLRLQVSSLEAGPFRLRAELFGPTKNDDSVGVGTSIVVTLSSQGGGLYTLVLADGSASGIETGRYSVTAWGVSATPPYAPSLFSPAERRSDPLLLDDGGDAGLGPRIANPGEPFNVLLDCSGASAPGAFAIWATADSRAALATRLGWLYLGGHRLLTTSGVHARSSETWFAAPAGLVLPNAPALVGLRFTVQGVCGGYPGGQARLSSALTQTIGPR